MRARRGITLARLAGVDAIRCSEKVQVFVRRQIIVTHEKVGHVARWPSHGVRLSDYVVPCHACDTAARAKQCASTLIV
jgi:hypothetical protein